MHTRFELIVVKCTLDGSTAYGPSLRTEETHDSAKEVLAHMAPFCQRGLCVIVRPFTKNLHEYRSFNGEPFKLVTFGA